VIGQRDGPAVCADSLVGAEVERHAGETLRIGALADEVDLDVTHARSSRGLGNGLVAAAERGGFVPPIRDTAAAAARNPALGRLGEDEAAVFRDDAPAIGRAVVLAAPGE
jgi:hypothetical protein